MIKKGYEFIKNYSLNHCSDDIVIVMDNTLKIRWCNDFYSVFTVKLFHIKHFYSKLFKRAMLNVLAVHVSKEESLCRSF